MNVERSQPASEARKIAMNVRAAAMNNGLWACEGKEEGRLADRRLRMGRIPWINFRPGCRLTARGQAARHRLTAWLEPPSYAARG